MVNVKPICRRLTLKVLAQHAPPENAKEISVHVGALDCVQDLWYLFVRLLRPVLLQSDGRLAEAPTPFCLMPRWCQAGIPPSPGGLPPNVGPFSRTGSLHLSMQLSADSIAPMMLRSLPWCFSLPE